MAKPFSTPEEIGKMYDQVSPTAELCSEGQEHLAYWYGAEDDTPIIEASQRITRKVAETLALRSGEYVLDAGCGVGVPAVAIAKETGARILGITVSEVEVLEGKRRATANGVDDRVEFQQGDYQSIPAPDGTFDAIYAMEALQHAPDVNKVLAEFHRVLRPGGRIAVSDITRDAGMSDAEAAELQAKFQTNALLTGPAWIAAFEAAGFRVEEYTQCGPRVYGMGSDRYIARVDELGDTLLSAFGAEGVEGLKQGYQGFFGERMDYMILTVRKPAR